MTFGYRKGESGKGRKEDGAKTVVAKIQSCQNRFQSPTHILSGSNTRSSTVGHSWVVAFLYVQNLLLIVLFSKSPISRPDRVEVNFPLSLPLYQLGLGPPAQHISPGRHHLVSVEPSLRLRSNVVQLFHNVSLRRVSPLSQVLKGRLCC
jgi:hypothetical protein